MRPPPFELHSTYCLSDMGQTAAYLADLHIYIYKRKGLVKHICKTLNVEERNGELVAPLEDISKLGHTLTLLSQACIRISDFCFTQNFRIFSSYKNRVTEFLGYHDLIYSKDIVLRGKYDKEVTIDFEVRGRVRRNLIITLSTFSRASSHTMANEAFTRWHDLGIHRGRYGFLTLYDSLNRYNMRQDDIIRLKEVSSVFAFPAEESSVYEILAA
jgi:hypothetical protein